MKYIVVHNSLVIECPKCGGKCCSVYDDDECYKELLELYNKVRK